MNGWEMKRSKRLKKPNLDEIVTLRFYSRYVAPDEIQDLHVSVGRMAPGAGEQGALESLFGLETTPS
jgi:hypothetical protein